MNDRPDISDKLIHFTSGDNLEDAFANLCGIVESRQIRGGGGFIKGGYRCICWSEAPLDLLPNGLIHPDMESRYSPFGIVVDKDTIFDLGGRPVIYQPDPEFELLPDEMKWRHVRYEPTGDPRIDFTWEREWRLQEDEFHIDPAMTAIVVPNESWADTLVDGFNQQQDWLVEEYGSMFGRSVAEQYREDFRWPIYTLTRD